MTMRGGLVKADLKCVLANARSLKNKLPELHHALYDQLASYDCLFFTESWLNNCVPNSLLDPNDQYFVFRSDRQRGNGGGVCAFINKKFNCLSVDLPLPAADIDLVCFDIVFSRALKYRFVLFYRPPGIDVVSYQTASLLLNALEQVATADIPTFIVTDLNCPNIDWQLQSRTTGAIDTIFSDFFTNNGYEQCVRDATRGSNVLDLVLCNEPILMSNIDVLPPFGSSDHNSIEFVVLYNSTDSSPDSGEKHKRYLWSQGDYESMAAYLHQVRWSDLLTTNFTANDLWSAFCNVMNNAIDEFVPCTFVSVRPKLRKRKYPRNIRNLINRKRAAWRNMKRNQDNLNCKIKYNRISTACRLAMRRYECWLESRVIDCNDIGAFYKFVNSKSPCRSGVGTLKGPDGKAAVSDQEKADLLNSYFGSVCTVDDGSRPYVKAQPHMSVDSNISDVVFTETNVLKAIRRIKTKSKFAGDPDGYPDALLQNCDPYFVVLYHCFSIHLCLLVSCLTHGRKLWLPRCLRKAHRLTLQTIAPSHRQVFSAC